MIRNFSITVSIDDNTIVTCDNFSVEENKITFLLGESGIGKSLLSRVVYGVADKEYLDIKINGQDYLQYVNSKYCKEIMRNSFFVFQEPSSHLNPILKIEDQIREGDLSLIDEETEEEILSYLWMHDTEKNVEKILQLYPKPYVPSGGEKQRILLAMAFKKITMLKQGQNTFFVFDEPTGSLDNTYRNIFLKLLLSAYTVLPFTVFVITHDYSIISEIYENYRKLLPNIRFKELTKENNNKVILTDFSAKKYIDWIESEKPIMSDIPQKDIVLKVKSEFTIFNRNIGIFEDAGFYKKCNLVIKKGEVAYLKAKSGTGKTTLAKIIMGLYKPQKFEMTLCGMTVTESTKQSLWEQKIWAKKAGMIFQHADEAIDLEASVKDVFKGLPNFKASDDELKHILSDIFDNRVDDSFLRKKVKFLSGGQKQRLNIMRTFLVETDLVIMDEPLNGLDFESIKKILLILRKKVSAGLSVLLISHNEEIFGHLVPPENVYFMKEL